MDCAWAFLKFLLVAAVLLARLGLCYVQLFRFFRLNAFKRCLLFKEISSVYAYLYFIVLCTVLTTMTAILRGFHIWRVEHCLAALLLERRTALFLDLEIISICVLWKDLQCLQKSAVSDPKIFHLSWWNFDPASMMKAMSTRKKQRSRSEWKDGCGFYSSNIIFSGK